MTRPGRVPEIRRAVQERPIELPNGSPAPISATTNPAFGDTAMPYRPATKQNQLAEKLQKSEASRKKLREALSILNEKLDLTEKVLKHNETLRKECERERQHAEEERKRADEERRHKEILEIDLIAYREQLSITTMRLEKVEKNQILEKKELDCLRDEVRIAVDGVHAAAQAVQSLESLLQNLETSLLAKKSKCRHVQDDTDDRPNGKKPRKKSRKCHRINLHSNHMDNRRKNLDSYFGISDSGFEDDWLTNINLLSPTLPNIASPICEQLSSSDFCLPIANMGTDTEFCIPVHDHINGKARNVNDSINIQTEVGIISENDAGMEIVDIGALAFGDLPLFSSPMKTACTEIVNSNIDQMASELLDLQQDASNSVDNFQIPALVTEESRNAIENDMIASCEKLSQMQSSYASKLDVSTISFGTGEAEHKQIGSGSELDFSNIAEINLSKLNSTMDSVSLKPVEAASLLNKEITDLHDVPFIGCVDRVLTQDASECSGWNKCASSICQVNSISEFSMCEGRFSESNEQDAANQVLQHNDIPVQLHDSCPRFFVMSLLVGSNISTSSEKNFISLAAIVSTRIKNCFSAKYFDKEVVNILEDDLASATISSKFPREILICSLISAAVDIAISECKLDNNVPEQGSSYQSLHLFIEVLQRVIARGGAIGLIDNMVKWVGRFLLDGTIMLVTFEESIALDFDISSLDDKMEGVRFSSLSSSTASLKEIQIGSMVVASLCQAFSSANHLQALVYQILRWCDKDIVWILTIFSTFASICGHASFESGPSDLLGQTISAIILELLVRLDLAAAERVRLDDEIEIALCNLNGKIEGLEDLRKCLRKGQSGCLEELILSVLGFLHYILTPGQNATVDFQNFSEELFNKRMLSIQMLEEKGSIACLFHDTKYKQESDLNFQQYSLLGMTDNRNVTKTPSVVVASEIGSEMKGRWQGVTQMLLDWNSWQRKYQEILGAVELISFYMGWEWTYNDLIAKHLWKLMIPSASQGMLIAVIQIIGMCGRIGRSDASNELPGMEELRKCLCFILSPSFANPTDASDEYYFPFFVQIAAVYALLCLSAPCSLFEENCSSPFTSGECYLQSCESETFNPLFANLVKCWLSNIGIQKDCS